MPEPLTIAYLTSAYARASDSFIRGEVEQLRALGFTVCTFSIRRPPASEVVSEEIGRERAATEYVLIRANTFRLVCAFLETLIHSPRKLVAAAMLSLRCSNPGVRSRIWALAYLVEGCFLAKRLSAKAVDHLHNHFGEGSAVVAMLTGLLAEIPYSLTIHGPSELDRWSTLSLDEKISRAAFTVTVSDYGRSQLLRSMPFDLWSKIKIVHCGVDNRFLAPPLAPSGGEPRFVCVARLAAEKGLLTLLDATRSLAQEGHLFQVVLIGDGPMRQTIEHMVEQYALHEHVTLTGWLSAHDVRNEILRARAVVLPSFSENLPVAIMEALALSRPVISTYIGGIPELVRDGVCGWLVPASSVAALTSAMREALSTPPQQLEKMGRAGAALVAARHNAAVEARKLASLFRRTERDALVEGFGNG